jgi:hypothetical protein
LITVSFAASLIPGEGVYPDKKLVATHSVGANKIEKKQPRGNFRLALEK